MPGTCREVFLGPALCSTAIRAPHHIQQGAVFPKTFGTFLSFQTLTWRIFIYKSLSPQLPLVFRRHHKYQIVSGAKSKTILRKPFVCTGYISSRRMNLIVSPWDVELSTTLCFSQGLNYIILLGNLKANVIWRQRNKKKMSLAVPWGTHGMERDTGESSWAMETLCLWIASRVTQRLWPT